MLEALFELTLQASDERQGIGGVGAASEGSSGVPGRAPTGSGAACEGAVPSDAAVEQAPLVVEHVARSMGPLLHAGIEACREELAELRLALSRGEGTQLLLHSLCGHFESMGAARIAQRCVQLKQRDPAHCDVRAVDELDTLLAQTEAALGTPDSQKASQPSSRPSSPASAASLPESLADSLPAIRILAHVRGSSPVPQPSHEDGPISAAYLDDSDLLRRMMRDVLGKMLHADASRSRALGATREEQLSFVDFALGRVDMALRPLPPPHVPVDLVVVDQHVLLDGAPHLLGSALVEQLRVQGFHGVTCLMTADREDIRELGMVPGVDLAVQKGVALSSLAKQLRKLVRARQQPPMATTSSGGTMSDGAGPSAQAASSAPSSLH